MKTKDFIKILQEADPSGEAHIRMPDGIPFAAELKPGYWDGPYNYLDEDQNWVYSTENNKVDIHCRDIYDHVDLMMSTYSIPSWEEVTSKFKFNLGYSFEPHRKEGEDRILKEAKEAYEHLASMHGGFRDGGVKRALENSERGWTWFQNKLADDPTLKPNIHKYYTWKVYDENGKEECSNLHNVEAILNSGLFERIDNEVQSGFYQWVKK
jgi:hypothetical protein